MPEAADTGRRRLRADVPQIATADEGRMSAAGADSAVAETANETTTSEKPGDDPMTTDEFAKTANALLVEGLALLCGHADDWPAIERYAKAVKAWRAQYRAAKEAPAPVAGEHVVHLTVDATTPTAPERCYMPTENPDGTWTTKFPAPEPTAPPAGVPVCPNWCGLPYGDVKVPYEWSGPGGMPFGVPRDGPPGVVELPAYCSGECQNARPLNPPPSDPVTVATGGVPVHGCKERRAMSGLTFNAFAALNRKRCEVDFHRTLDDTNDHTVETWALKLLEEAGEVAQAVLRFGGKSARKSRTTEQDIGDEISDVVSYCALLANRLGLDFEQTVIRKWNAVSERVGSVLRIEAAIQETGGVPTGFRLGAGWTHIASPSDDVCCTHEADPLVHGWIEPAVYDQPLGKKAACAAHAVAAGALVPVYAAGSAGPGDNYFHEPNAESCYGMPPMERMGIDTARSVPPGPVPGDVPLLVSKLGERICDCGDSEQEHSGPDHHCPRDQGVFSHARRPRPSDAVLLVGGHCSGWGVNCAWKGCSFRTPEFTVAWAAREAIVGHIKSTHLAPAQPAAPASEPAVRPLTSSMETGVEWCRKNPDIAAMFNADFIIALADRYDAARAEVEQLRDKLAEAEENVERVAARSKEIFTEAQADETKYQAEIKRLTKERVDIGNRYDLHMADCQRRQDETRGKHEREVEQLRGKLAENAVDVAERTRASMEAEATARVRSMREAAAKVAREQIKYLESINLTEFGDGALNKARTILAEIERLPLDTGTATDAGGEAGK